MMGCWRVCYDIGVRTECEITHASAGEDAILTVHFSEDLSKEHLVDFSIQHQRHNSPGKFII